MATFNSAVVGSKLNYDFSHWNGGAGVIPEPSDKMIEQFFDGIKELTGDEDIDPDNPESAAEALDNSSFAEVKERSLQLFAELCQHSPGVAQLSELPPRVRQTFFKWLLKQVQDPELEASATTKSPNRRSGG